jgi:VWFA-related protein
MKSKSLLAVLLISAAPVFAGDDPVVFKSDVTLTRVDVQVLDRDGRAVTGLGVKDFVLRLDGKVLPIHNFASESMPIDILLLLDVSGSMRPHVERIAEAAEQALNVLAQNDRVAVMIFDTSTHVRLPFRANHGDVTNALDHILRSEGFNGGTRITHAMISAANYVQANARPDARRAIVVLTDDETQDSEDEPRVESALAKADAVLSFLQAPYEPPTMGGYPGGRRRHGGTWGSGGGVGFPGGGGGIGFPGGGWPGGGGGGPVVLGRGGDPSHSAGTREIAADSGGDTMSVDDASALEETLQRLRQRYALHFDLPEGMSSAEARAVQVDLASNARIMYADSEVKSRVVFANSGTSSVASRPQVVTRTQPSADVSDRSPSDSSSSADSSSSDESRPRRHVAVNDGSTGPIVDTVDNSSSDQSSDSQPTQPAANTGTSTKQSTQPRQGGWPRANPQQSQ